MLPPTPAGPPLLHIQHGRATITLNRPDHHNRLHTQDLLVLQQHFTALAADPTLRLLVLTGNGPTFCSGFHIGELGGAAAGQHDTHDHHGAGPTAGPALFAQTVDALEALPLPTICRLNGSVYGGATDLALACDFRVGVAGMALRMPAARLGLHYYPSGLQRYVTRLGLAAAKRLFLLAENMPAERLLALGYLDCLAASGQLDAEVQAMADALAAGAPLALRGMKTSLNEIARAELNLPALQQRAALCAASDDLREGQAAFSAKRSPRFTGG